MSTLLPIFIELKGKPVLLIGGGKVALEKLEKLVQARAAVTVIARAFHPRTLQLIVQHGLRWEQRDFAPDDMQDQFVIISAVNDAAQHAAIAAHARRERILINAVDAPESSDFYFGAQIERGALQLAISTNGLFPGVARAIRLWLEDIFPADFAGSFAELIELRRSLRDRIPDPLQRMQALRDQLQIWMDRDLPHPAHSHDKTGTQL